MLAHDRIVGAMSARVRQPIDVLTFLAAGMTLLAAAPVARHSRPTVTQAPAAGASVTCRVPADPDARVYVLHGPAPPPEMGDASGEPARGLYDGWQMALRSTRTADRWIRLALPGARPEISDRTARLSYRNANGGRQVDLAVEPGGASLDVWVDHGLEVNIDPDLDPRVDLLNTEGRLEGLDCTIVPAGELKNEN